MKQVNVVPSQTHVITCVCEGTTFTCFIGWTHEVFIHVGIAVIIVAVAGTVIVRWYPRYTGIHGPT